MWRAFGGTDVRVALVFKFPFALLYGNVFNLIVSPVAYMEKEQGRPLSLWWSRARISFCATITLALGTHPVRGKGRSPPDLQLSFVNLLSAQCADNGHEMKGGIPADRFHRTSIPSGPTQSPISEGPSQESVENGKCEITDRGTVPDRASLRICSWPKLKAHVDLLEESGQLKQAIDTNDLDTVKTLMTRNPALHRSPLGYAKNGPLTWVAECRVQWGPPSPARLAMAEWMIDHGSDVHQGGDGPLMRATLGDRIAMMELLVSRGADGTLCGTDITPSYSALARLLILPL